MAKKKGESQEDKLVNLQAQQLAAQVANWAAQLDFQKERFRLLELPEFQMMSQLEIDKLAWQKAMDQWDHNFQEASVTGMYNGVPTIQWLTDQARMTGTYNGQRTLEGMLTDAQIRDMQDKMKLANDQFVSATTGYFNGQKTFDREKFEAAQALEGWKFISTLSGPQNAFKQARAIASIPGGVGQFMQAFAGQYMLPSGGAVGSGGSSSTYGMLSDMMLGYEGAGSPRIQGGAASIPAIQPTPQAAAGTITQPAMDSAAYAAPPDGVGAGSPATVGVNSGAYSYQPPGVQAPVQAWNYSGTADGSVGVYPPGTMSPVATPDVSTTVPENPSQFQPVINTPYAFAGQITKVPGQGELTLPNQINLTNWNNAYDYQKQLLVAQYEDAGWDPGLVQEAIERQKPKYASPTKGAYSF